MMVIFVVFNSNVTLSGIVNEKYIDVYNFIELHDGFN